ncbi:MAG: hypothetical protein FWH03_07910 [Firmicutes bacterium]|nr:hypothetical protein [Bacillota bacterium]
MQGVSKFKQKLVFIVAAAALILSCLVFFSCGFVKDVSHIKDGLWMYSGNTRMRTNGTEQENILQDVSSSSATYFQDYIFFTSENRLIKYHIKNKTSAAIYEADTFFSIRAVFEGRVILSNLDTVDFNGTRLETVCEKATIFTPSFIGYIEKDSTQYSGIIIIRSKRYADSEWQQAQLSLRWSDAEHFNQNHHLITAGDYFDIRFYINNSRGYYFWRYDPKINTLAHFNVEFFEHIFFTDDPIPKQYNKGLFMFYSKSDYFVLTKKLNFSNNTPPSERIDLYTKIYKYANGQFEEIFEVNAKWRIHNVSFWNDKAYITISKRKNEKNTKIYRFDYATKSFNKAKSRRKDPHAHMPRNYETGDAVRCNDYLFYTSVNNNTWYDYIIRYDIKKGEGGWVQQRHVRAPDPNSKELSFNTVKAY